MSRFDFSQCPGYCERARKLMFLQNPIIQKRLAGPKPCVVPAEQELAMRLEDRDELNTALAETNAEIKRLRDCAQWGVRA